MKKWDILVGATGFFGTLTLKDALSIAVGCATLVLLLLRIWLTWKHRDKPPKD